MAKKLYSPSESWIVAALNLPKDHTGSFFSSLQQQLWSSFWVFWKKLAPATSCWKVIRWYRLTYQGNQMGSSQHSQNSFPWPLFAWNGTLCPRSIFTELWNCRESWFYEPRNWGLLWKEVFSTSEIFADLHLPGKHTGSFFFVSKQMIWW